MSAYPWIKSYPDGVRWDVELPVTPVQDIIDRSAAQWPDLVAIDFMGRRFSYNVYPRNIEEAIYAHPSVAEVSVIGIPDAYRGQSS